MQQQLKQEDHPASEQDAVNDAVVDSGIWSNNSLEKYSLGPAFWFDIIFEE